MRAILISATAFILGACAARHVRQPHMHHALELLRAAHGELETATADKGGHRVAAMQLITQAIDEVRAGIDFDNTH